VRTAARDISDMKKEERFSRFKMDQRKKQDGEKESRRGIDACPL
jgi:hypothetical protein